MPFRSDLPFCGVIAAMLVVFACPEAECQILKRALVLRDARILTMTGDVIEKGTVICKGDRIEAVGPDAKPPLLSRVVDVSGKTVTPGLIDVCSTLARTSPSRVASADQRAVDAFDMYDVESIQTVLGRGVSTIYLSTGGAVGVDGRGAIFRLTRNGNGSLGQLMRGDVALDIDLGSYGGTLARVRTLASVRGKFEAAQRYRQSVEDYDEAVKEYEKKLQEKLEKDKKQKESGQKPKPDEKKNGDRPEGERTGTATDEPETKEAAGARARPAGRAAEKDEGPKKPARPPRNPEAEILLQAMDRKIPVRVEASRSADIVNAVRLAEEFSLRLVLVGAEEASFVADDIPDDVAVVLRSPPRDTPIQQPTSAISQYYSSLLNISPQRSIASRIRREVNNGARLRAAGLQVYVGGGCNQPLGSQFLLEQALLDAAADGDQDVLRRVTRAAAELLQVADQIGSIAPGRLADLVVWNGDPRDPSTQVEQVYVGGELAFERKTSDVQ